MDIFFQDPNDIPLPPEEVRIRQFHAEPWPDGRRVRVTLELTPFLKKPNGEIHITDSAGNEVVTLSIIETMDPKMDFTMHLRGVETGGTYTASARVFYLEEPEEGQEQEADPHDRPPVIVDQAEATFDVPAKDG